MFFGKNWILYKMTNFPYENSKNAKIDTFTFLAISLAIFELERRTMPHIYPLNNSF